MENRLQEKLQHQIVIFDGAIGTEIYRRNFFVNTSFEGLCLSAPKIVSEIHQSYVDAGAEVLTTNTFNANFNKLSRFGLGDQVRAINQAAVKLARQAGGTETLIAGSLGPIGEIDRENGYSEDRILGMLEEQAAALADAQADFLLFESLGSIQDTERALRVAGRVPTLPYVLSFSLDRNAESGVGEPLDGLLKRLETAAGHPPTALGLNCGQGPEGMLAALEIFSKKVSLPIIIQPNAGIPKRVDNRMIYMTSPEYLTTYAVRYVNLGVRGVGGCCGIGPEHIRDLVRSIKPLGHSTSRPVMSVAVEEEATLPPIPLEEKSQWGAKLARGEWVTSVEITPPRGFDLTGTVQKAIQCREAGVDAINLPDGPRASSRISSLIAAIEIQEKAGIEPILHCCCRDKSLIGLQADMLGCACKNIRNILFITGDPPKLGDYPFSSGVFDVDSIGMVKIQARLNTGLDLGGKALGAQTAVVIGVGADPSALDLEREYRRTCEKVEAGAEFMITQPVFAIEPLLHFLDRIAHLHVPVIAGIWPLASYRNAEFMRNEVPGVVVPDSIMERMARAQTKEAQRDEGIQIARKAIAAIRNRVQGVQVSAPFGNVNTAIAVIRQATDS